METNIEKKILIDKTVHNLTDIASKKIKNKDYQTALEALSSSCSIHYEANQQFTDNVIENMIQEISSQIVKTPKDFSPKKNIVLFYDGFGLDIRGWAASYVRSLVKCGYQLIYVTDKRQKDKIPHILAEMKDSDAVMCFINIDNHSKCIDELNNIFTEYRPKSAFFYTKPDDVSAAVVFDAYAGKVDRFLIDLTDHAFWVGVNAADFFLECRIPGASNAIYERGIDRDKLINIDCCLYINKDIDNTLLPFDIEKERYIFSGGALYKTLGDDNLLFYKVVNDVLRQNSDVKYLYAGEGNTSAIQKLSSNFPGRVFYIHERTDFYRLIENCEFVWNTYPMFGGLMMRLSANAGKIPVTLKYEKNHEGLLKNQSALGIEFDTYEEVVKEMNTLLADSNYKKSKEKLLYNAVVTEDEFTKNLFMIIEEHRSEFEFDDIPYVDTEEFKKTYLERIENTQLFLSQCIIRKNSLKLVSKFPELAMVRIANKLRWKNK